MVGIRERNATYPLPCSAMFYIPFIKFEFTYLLTIPSLLGK